ncbi:MAG: indole-3-glycerol phosphate synthase TrpC [Alphaproteobacteria bacterium]
MTDKLHEIFTAKKESIATMMAKIAPAVMRDMAQARQNNGRKFYSLFQSLRAASNGKTLPLIAEIKKASPAHGVIKDDFSPINLAQDYITAGAGALSVLTEQQWFQGSPQYLKDIAKMTQKPILQKDFIFCDYQIYHAVAIGADAILLILSYLDEKTAHQLENMAMAMGLEVLLEAHDENDIARANQMASPLVGVNNRNLHDLSVSLTHGEKMLNMISDKKLAIAESGLASPIDVKKMWQAGARGFLIGAYFMQQADVFTACHQFIHHTNIILFS